MGKNMLERRLRVSPISLWVAALFMAVLCAASAIVFGAPDRAYAVSAANGAYVATLEEGYEYNQFDITGDGKPDSIYVEAWGLNEDWDSYDYIDVYINDQLVLSHTCRMATVYYPPSCPEIRYIRLKNGQPFLYLSTWGDDIGAEICGIFQYRSGSLRQVIDCNKFFGSRFCTHRNGEVRSVSGNNITMQFEGMSWMAGNVRVACTYKYKNGTLKKTSNIGKLQILCGGQTHKALKKITAYKNTSCKAKKFTIKKGQKVRFLKAYVKGNTVRFQVKAGGKTGWIKCATSMRSPLMYKKGDYRPPFQGLHLAG